MAFFRMIGALVRFLTNLGDTSPNQIKGKMSDWAESAKAEYHNGNTNGW